MTFLLLIFAIACEDELEDQNNLSTTEKLIVQNNWQLDTLFVNNKRVFRVSTGFELASGQVTSWAGWFWYNYNTDLSYDFRSDGFRTSLGYEENFQPEYGYWDVDEQQNLLIHNRGLNYETHYRIIELNDTLFIREYDRIIYESSDTVAWPIGSTAIYREHLKKRETACC